MSRIIKNKSIINSFRESMQFLLADTYSKYLNSMKKDELRFIEFVESLDINNANYKWNISK